MGYQCYHRGIVVFVIFLALLLDSLLLTCVVPIIPSVLRDAETGDLTGKNGSCTATGYPASHGDQLHTNLPSFTGSKAAGNIFSSNNTITFAKKSKEADVEHIHDPGNVSTGSLEQLSDFSPHVLLLSVPTNGPERRMDNDDMNTSYINENTRVGVLFSSKTTVQMVSNLFVGTLTNRIGYTVPLFGGFITLFISTITFAFANSYELLFFSRAIQGMGTAFTTTSGMALLALLYPDQRERGRVQTLAFSGLVVGVIIGPAFGGVLYDLTGGKETPFLILAGVALVEGLVQLLVIRPRVEPESVRGPSLLVLITDPYILLTALTITVSHLPRAVLESVLPVWMFYTMGAPEWLQGLVFLPSTLSYLTFLQVYVLASTKLGCLHERTRWVFALLGLTQIAVAVSVIPACSNVYQLLGLMFVLGLSLAMVSSSMLPHIGFLVDHRHTSAYGNAYAITDNAFCLSFALGPAFSGPVTDAMGMTWTLRGVAALCLLTAPWVVCLRDPPGKITEEVTTVGSGEKTYLNP